MKLSNERSMMKVLATGASLSLALLAVGAGVATAHGHNKSKPGASGSLSATDLCAPYTRRACRTRRNPPQQLFRQSCLAPEHFRAVELKSRSALAEWLFVEHRLSRALKLFVRPPKTSKST